MPARSTRFIEPLLPAAAGATVTGAATLSGAGTLAADGTRLGGFRSAVGHTALPTATGNFALIDGLAFAPTVFGTFFTQQTATGYAAGLLAHMGATTNVGEDFAVQVVSTDAVGSSDTGRARAGNRLILGAGGAGAMTLTIEADTVSMDADGGTLNFLTPAPAAAFLAPWFALGGSVAADVVAVDSTTTGGGTNDFTATGFGTPLAAIVVSAFPQGTTTAAGAVLSIGATDGTNQWCASFTSRDGQGLADVGSSIRTDRVLACINPLNAAAYVAEASFNSWITNGVRLTFNTAPAVASATYVILLKGGAWRAGTETQRASNGTKTTTGLSMTPRFGMFAGAASPVVNTVETDADAGRFFIGMTDGTNQRGISWHDVDAQDTQQVEQSQYHDRVIRHHAADGGTKGDATISLSTSTDEFTATWSGTDGSTSIFGYLVGGDAPAGAVTVTGDALLAGTGTLAASGSATVFGSATMSGTGSLAAAGVQTASGAAALSGAGTLTPVGRREAVQVLTVARPATASLVAARTVFGAAALSGTSTLAGTGVRTAFGAAAISGTGTLAARRGVVGVYEAAVLALGPDAYWPLYETSGTAADEVVQGLNGTYTGSPTLGGTGLQRTTPNDPTPTFDGVNDYVEVADNDAFSKARILAKDTFTRTSTDTWGTADLGGSWTVRQGVTGDYDTTGTVGTLDMHASGPRSATLPLSVADVDVKVKATWDQQSVGVTPLQVMARWESTTKHYYAQVRHSATGTIQLAVYRLDTSATLLAGPYTLTTSHVLGSWWWLRLQVNGSLVRAKAWADGTDEPDWQLSPTDSVITAAGAVGVKASAATVQTYASFDEFRATTPDNGLTVVAWVRPDVAIFANDEAEGYVHSIGKGETGQYEWSFRFYSNDWDPDPNRADRISFYAWSLSGSFGSGAAFQAGPTTYAEHEPGDTLMVAGVMDDGDMLSQGRGVQLYRNGVFKSGTTTTAPALYSYWNLEPDNGTAPLRFGTRDLVSFFQGGISHVTIFKRKLSEAELTTLYNAGFPTRTARLTGTGTLTADGNVVTTTEVFGSATLAGTGSLAAAGRLAAQRSLASARPATATLTRLVARPRTLTVTRPATATLRRTLPRSLTVARPASASLARVRTALGIAALSGTGSLQAAGVRERLGIVALSGAGTLAADGIRSVLGAAALAASGSLAALGSLEALGQALLSGTSSMTVSGYAVVFMRPDSVISSGTWTPVGAATLWQALDEVTASDSDYIESADSPASADVCEVGLSNQADPEVSYGHVISYRYRKDTAAGDTIDLTVRLIQGTTVIASWTHTNISADLTAEQILTGGQADAISAYNDLRLRFEAAKP